MSYHMIANRCLLHGNNWWSESSSHNKGRVYLTSDIENYHCSPYLRIMFSFEKALAQGPYQWMKGFFSLLKWWAAQDNDYIMKITQWILRVHLLNFSSEPKKPGFMKALLKHTSFTRNYFWGVQWGPWASCVTYMFIKFFMHWATTK